ncbi:unnamed protein product [Rotaria sp. Silwood1]|nr:unnamed protein product [Rotaria sp. Silwood1]
MSNIISVHCLFQFLIFIYIIPIYISIETKIKIVFLHGLNVIRCSHSQVQVYKLDYHSGYLIDNLVTCNTKDEIYSEKYTGFKWGQLNLVCSSDNTQVHEEQSIFRSYGDDSVFITYTKGQLYQSKVLYKLKINHSEESKYGTIISNNQPANDAYFSEHTAFKERRIYIWFPDHPIICRLIFTSNEDNPCPSMDGIAVKNVNYTCYYNPGADKLPTKEQMEAELEQIEETDEKPNTDAYVLELEAPESTPIDSSEASDDNSNNQANNSSYNNNIRPRNSTELNGGLNTQQIIGLVLGILLLIGLICGFSYFIIQKYYFKKSSSSSGNIEKDSKDSYSLGQTQSQQTLAVTSTHKTNTNVFMNVPPKEDETFVNLHPSDGNKRQKVDTSMIFNEDM